MTHRTVQKIRLTVLISLHCHEAPPNRDNFPLSPATDVRFRSTIHDTVKSSAFDRKNTGKRACAYIVLCKSESFRPAPDGSVAVGHDCGGLCRGATACPSASFHLPYRGELTP